jgi:hypothetical protein
MAFEGPPDRPLAGPRSRSARIADPLREAIAAVAVLAVVFAIGGAVLIRQTGAVQRVEGIDVPVTALRWNGNTTLELGTAGSGVVTWDLALGEVQADPFPDRGRQTILELPDLPAETFFTRRPSLVLRTVIPGVPDSNRAELLAALGSEGRLKVLDFVGAALSASAPATYLAENVAFGMNLIVRVAPTEPETLQYISQNRGESRAPRTLTGGPVSAMAAGQDFRDLFVGTEDGALWAYPLSEPALFGARELYNFADLGDRTQPVAVTAIATAGVGDAQTVVAAAADGRVIWLRSPDSPGSLDLPRFLQETRVGVTPPSLSVERLPGAIFTGIAAPGVLEVLGFSRDRRSVSVYDPIGRRVIQAEVGGNGQVVLPLREASDRLPPVFDVQAFGLMLSDLPLLQADALLPLLNQADATQTFAEAVENGPSPVAPGLTLQDVMSWRLPLALVTGDVASPLSAGPTRASIGQPGSARDPDTGRIALWGSNGEIVVASPDSEELSADLGDGTPVADAAFEPGTGALVILYADGRARRYDLPDDQPEDLFFEPPRAPDGGPPGEALALAFPPDQMTTTVMWGRTATVPGILRRYDRSTGMPLGPGLDIDFESYFLPDRSNILISNVNGEELEIRDTRTGAFILSNLFEGGSLALAPSNDGRDIGVVYRDNAVWTLRLDRPEGGEVAEPPAELGVFPTADVGVIALPRAVAPHGLELSADGRVLVVRLPDGRVFVAELPPPVGEEEPFVRLREVLAPAAIVMARLLPDGSALLMAGSDHVLWRVDLDDGDRVSPILQLPGPVRSMALSPDGTLLAVAADGGNPLVVDVERASWLASVPTIGHRPYATPLPLAPRGGPLGSSPQGASFDYIVLATYRTEADADALYERIVGQWPEASIIQETGGETFHVAVPLTGTSHLSARADLLRARAAFPETRAAALVTLAEICPVPVDDTTPTVLCIEPPPTPSAPPDLPASASDGPAAE